jgi:hypothetical protein
MVKIAYALLCSSCIYGFTDPSSAERLPGSIVVVSDPSLTVCVMLMYDF